MGCFSSRPEEAEKNMGGANEQKNPNEGIALLESTISAARGASIVSTAPKAPAAGSQATRRTTIVSTAAEAAERSETPTGKDPRLRVGSSEDVTPDLEKPAQRQAERVDTTPTGKEVAV